MTESVNLEAREGKYEKKKMHLLEEMKMFLPCYYVFWRLKHLEKECSEK